MIAYSLVLGAGIVVDAWLLALVGLRGRRPWLQATFAALALTFIVSGAAFIGTSEGFLAPSWESVVLGTLVLANPLTAILVLSLIHGETLPRRRPIVFALLALAPLMIFLTPGADWGVQHAYDVNLLGAFLIVCLGIPLAEAAYLRMTSSLFAVDAFWLAVGVVALVIGGPIYSLEFGDLGILQAAGSNAAAPVALALFALVFFHADPFPGARPGPSRQGGRVGFLEPGQTVVFDEARPKYAVHTAARMAQEGRAVLVLARAGGRSDGRDARPGFVPLPPTRQGAGRSLGTVAEFFTRSPGGVAVLPDLDDVALMSGWAATEEAVLRLTSVCNDTRGGLILSTACLLPSERESLRKRKLAWWSLPDPAEEMGAVLGESFGPGARDLLASFARSRGLQPEDLTLDHVEPFLDFLERALSELGDSAADAPAREGLHAQAAAAARALRGFAARTPQELAQGDWPSRRSSETNHGILVTAADYWKGKEMQELFSAANNLGDRESVFEQARHVFVEQLGEAGEGVLRSELSKLGKRPEDLRRADVAHLADQATVDLTAMADVVDVPQEKQRIRSQVESIRRRLEAIAGDEA